MLSLLCFLLALWAISTLCVLVRKISLVVWWYILLSGSAILFYLADHFVWLCLSWSMMGFSSQAIVGRRPTVPTGNALASMIVHSTLSTFFCFSALFCICADADQEWKLSLVFPRKTMSPVHSLICFLSLSVKSLMFPFSSWLLSAMKGVATMSSLVHSLTIVASGLYLTTALLLEGVFWLRFVEGTIILFLPSSLWHLYFLLCESHGKRILAWSTAFSVNICHVLLPWDPRFSLLYGIFHGLSKSFLFACSQGQKSLSWSLMTGLLGGFPFSFVWKVKTSLEDSIVSSTFLLWAFLAYLFIFVKIGYKYIFSVNKSFLWEAYGQSWFSLAVLLSLVFL
uniref:NADH dehydrogenase subunit 5 n=1 Tax=Kudoa hexapunctata TaxID=1450334 RepID=A0A0H5AY42_9CNID|nr:NADH dehydrogenase subunit 5 [Kudoa hexapunctata]BAR94701.1 NADH dehydrogenase subunit 5 [Kudoa hexapunctata]